MGFIYRSVLLGLFLFGTGLVWYKFTQPNEIPEVDIGFWGRLTDGPDDESIRPFVIDIPQSEIDDLKAKLKRRRKFAEPLEDVKFQYGFNSKYLEKLLDYWQNEYNWTERQAFLNQYPQYKTKIAGLDIHFIHIRQENPKGLPVLPILFTHGFPNSMRVAYDFIPFVMNRTIIQDYVINIIVPSMPGYGFSEAPTRPGLAPIHIAKIFAELMTRLGHHRFIMAGGNWGGFINYIISVLYPDRIIGYHNSGCFMTANPQTIHFFLGTLFPQWLVSDHSKGFFRSQLWKFFEESGYWHLQATKPDTIGIGLNDSPAGMAAYLLEKFSTWTNVTWRTFEDGGLDNFDKNVLIDNVMVFWISKSITTAMRLYANAFAKEFLELKIFDFPSSVPYGCMMLDGDYFYVPKDMLRWNFYNLTQYKNYHKGGHFVDVEMPEIYAENMMGFVKTLV